MVAEKNPEIRNAVNTLYKISADDKIRAEYEARQKAWRDRESQFHGVREEGRMEGRMEGLAEGRAEIARKMKEMGISSEQILAATGIRL